MADNMLFTPGSGGTARSLDDGTATEWPVEVLAYATTLQPGLNVPKIVTPQSPLPVGNPDIVELLFRILRKLQYGLCSPDPFDDLDDGGGRTLETLLTSLNNRSGAAGYDTFNVTVNTTPSLIVPARPTRRLVTFLNTGAVAAYLVAPGKATASGASIAAGATAQMAVTCAVYYMVATGSAAGTLSGWEEFD